MSEFKPATEWELQRNAWANDTKAFQEAIARVGNGRDLSALNREEKAEVRRLAQHLKETKYRVHRLNPAVPVSGGPNGNSR